jgi:hypothetical protein
MQRLTSSRRRRGLFGFGPALALALALATSAAACGDLASLDEGVCASDADCASGLRCHAGRWCVAVPTEGHGVVLRMAPPPGSSAVLEHFEASFGGATEALGQTWQLTKPAVVHGTVLRAGDALSASIPGRLIALAPGKSPGTALHYEATSYHAPKRFAGSEVASGFELRVQIGPEYQVSFWPDRDEIPPWYGTWKVSGPVDGWAVLLPSEASLLRVRGRLRRGAAAAVDCGAASGATLPTCADGCEGLESMRVLLRDAEGRVRSNRVVTDKDGAFELLVDPNAGTTHLSVLPGAEAGVAPRATLALPIDLEMMRKKAQQVLELGDLVVPSPGDVGEAPLVIADSDGLPVAGAEVRVTREIKAPLGCLPGPKGGLTAQPIFDSLRYEAVATTDVAGGVKVDFAYSPSAVRVTPPPSQRAASRHFPAVSLQAESQTLTLGERVKWSGRVVDFRQMPQFGATVRLERVVSKGPAKSAADVVTATDVEGAFAVYLDAGRYAVVVDPPAGGGLARALVKVIDVDAEHAPLGGDLVLPAPAVIDGRIVDQDGAPVAGVVVDVIAPQLSGLTVGAGDAMVQDALETDDTNVLGTTVSDIDGHFEVLVATGQVAAP